MLTRDMLVSWLPNASELLADLAHVPPNSNASEVLVHLAHLPRTSDHPELAYAGKPLALFTLDNTKLFDAYAWGHWTAHRWELPLVAVSAYVLTIPMLRTHVAQRGKYNTRSFALWWNLGLSLFSVAGLSACLPVMASTLWSSGIDFTICANAAWYGMGWHGLWVALFIYSKLFELVDTALLLLSGRPVILLHWWHHVTVLLYCWHAYITRQGSGMWFATMNYGVHSLMYAYFALTQYSKAARDACKRFAMYITLLQIAQMVVGIGVTVRAIAVQAAGGECHVNKTNSILGLLMYASYLVLFLKLFLDNYVFKRVTHKKIQ